MDIMKRSTVLLSLLVLGLLLISSASAFVYFVEPLNTTITVDGTASFKITIRNTLETEDYFTISTRDVNWIITTEAPSSRVGPLAESAVVLQLRPKQSVPNNNVYIVPIKIKSESTGTYYEETRKFAVVVGEYGTSEYTPTVTPTIYMDKVIDPREKVSVRVNLKNHNRRELNDIMVTLDGEEFRKQYSVDILALEEKTTELLFNIDPLTLAGLRTLKIRLSYFNETIAESSKEYEVLGFVDMKENGTKETGWFRSEEHITIRNDGNQEGIAEHAFSLGLLERPFTKFDPDAVKEKAADGKKYYVVRSTLAPQQTLDITVVKDYRLLVALIFISILSTVCYFMFRSPVVLYKSAEPTTKANSDGLSEVKVRVFLRNRSGHPVSLVRVTDTIPSIADIKKTTHVGSMDPVNVTKGKRGTIARWEFDSLEPYEERVIAYKIESKLKLVGGINLPSAKARFEVKKGQERVTYSNNVNLIHASKDHQEQD